MVEALLIQASDLGSRRLEIVQIIASLPQLRAPETGALAFHARKNMGESWDCVPRLLDAQGVALSIGGQAYVSGILSSIRLISSPKSQTSIAGGSTRSVVSAVQI